MYERKFYLVVKEERKSQLENLLYIHKKMCESSKFNKEEIDVKNVMNI